MVKATAESPDEIEALLRQPVLPSLETILRMVRDRGYRINNMFHRIDGLWQANLRSKDNANTFEFAYGPSPGDAILKALQKVRQGRTATRTRASDDEADPFMVGSTKSAELPPNEAPPSRYWWHPESSSLFITAPGEPEPSSDGLLEEIDKDQYYEIHDRIMAQAPAAAEGASAEDDDLIG